MMLEMIDHFLIYDSKDAHSNLYSFNSKGERLAFMPFIFGKNIREN